MVTIPQVAVGLRSKTFIPCPTVWLKKGMSTGVLIRSVWPLIYVSYIKDIEDGNFLGVHGGTPCWRPILRMLPSKKESIRVGSERNGAEGYTSLGHKIQRGTRRRMHQEVPLWMSRRLTRLSQPMEF